MIRRRNAPCGARSQRGFSLIEVLIALLVLAIGLLGLAFLQVLNVRYTNSAQHRTMATNLATEAFDMMRSNPRHIIVYNRLTEASFTGFAVPGAGCSAVAEDAASALKNIDRWRCDVVSQLPGGRGSVQVVENPVGQYTATVTVIWVDNTSREQDGVSGGVEGRLTSFQVTSTL